MTDERNEAKARARQTAQAAQYRWRSRSHVTELDTIVGRVEAPKCSGCGGTLAQDELDTHPGCARQPEKEPA